MYHVPDLRAPADPSSGGQCVPLQLGDVVETSALVTVRRGTVCWLPTVGPVTLIHQELIMNPASHTATFWHFGFL